MGKYHFSLKYGQFPLVEFVEESGVMLQTEIVFETKTKDALCLVEIYITKAFIYSCMGLTKICNFINKIQNLEWIGQKLWVLGSYTTLLNKLH